MKLFWIYPWMVYSVRLLLTWGRPNSRWSVIDKLSARSRLAEGKTIKKSNYTTSLCCVDRNHVKPDKLYLWKNIPQNVGTTTIPRYKIENKMRPACPASRYISRGSDSLHTVTITRDPLFSK